MKLINLGCGPDGIDGWINYDWGWLPLINKIRLTSLLVRLKIIGKQYLRNWAKFQLVDIRKSLPLKSKSVDWIYCSHVVEHLEKWEAMSLLKEIRRVLKKKGRARIVVPDLDLIIGKYGRNAEEFNRKYFGFDKDINLGIINWLVRPHNWMYNQASFELMAKQAGFKQVTVSKYRNSNMPDVDKLDLEIHQDLSLYVELGND